jgi:tyrosyl-tRNA synthetase
MSNIITDKNRIEEIFSRGTVVEVLPSREAFIEKLMSGQRLRMYIGFDPTATSLHVGHAKNIMFMEELRQLGHEIIILFGDFTARIGDPDKNSTRKQLTEEDVKHNVSGWMQQVAPLIDFQDPVNPAKIMYNSVWLSKLNFSDIISIASNFTVQQMIERDLFAKRLAANAPIHLHEFMYPLMQGYDSVAMDVDVEVCGNDQIFNALAGRTLMKRMKDKDKIVVVPLGVDTKVFYPADEKEKLVIREKLGISKDSLVVGSFQKDGVGWGNGSEPKFIKGPDMFCSVIEHLAEKYPIHVILTGPARGYVKNRLFQANIPYTYKFLAYQTSIEGVTVESNFTSNNRKQFRRKGVV